MPHKRSSWWWLLGLVAVVAAARQAAPAADPPERLPPPQAAEDAGPTFPAPPSLLTGPCRPIDLASALRLAGVFNADMLLARQRVEAALAERQLAAAQILPSINAGGNYDAHTGNLQRSNGEIIEVNRNALYLGLGANAVGAGTVTVPGIVWNANVSGALFSALVRTQVVRQREFESVTVRNQVLLQVAEAYLDLLRAEGARAVLLQTRAENAEVARVTANFAGKPGLGRQADADRARAELEQRDAELLRAEQDVLTASARLCQLLHLDPTPRLHATDGWVVPAAIVPDPELIAVALTRRPELAERRAAVEAALLQLYGAKLLPFSPTALVGYSAGTFGGGSNLAAQGILQPDGTVLRQPRFDSFDGRQDLDVVLYWSLRNLGVGNLAEVQLARSQWRAEQLREMAVLDRVRAEVAAAQARAHARYAQIATGEEATKAAQGAFTGDFRRTRAGVGLPIEVLNSLRLLGRGRLAYLDAIIDYNRAQFELYVALGQPPASCLARPVPAELVPPPDGSCNLPTPAPLAEPVKAGTRPKVGPEKPE